VEEAKVNNLYILGAGFSKPAGMPLTKDVFSLVLEEAKTKAKEWNWECDSILGDDINQFLRYWNSVNRRSIRETEINFEEFLSFLDIEHFLYLKGRNHEGPEGNRSQMIIRNLIARILHTRLKLMKEDDFKLYDDFANKLEPGDKVLTFNYDTILEQSLQRVKKPFRLFPRRMPSANSDRGITTEQEVIVLKVHGSIDWFDVRSFEIHRNQYSRVEYITKQERLFGNDFIKLKVQKVADDPYYARSPLNSIYRTDELEEYFKTATLVTVSPIIMPPSWSKILYLNPLRDFWFGFNEEGAFRSRVTIIGFSFPEHDEYIKQPMFRIIDNFQNYSTDYPELQGDSLKELRNYYKKDRLKIVDFQEGREEILVYKNRYSFVNWDLTDCCWTGFDQKALEIIFPTGRK
jgi:hypothetical protein